MMTWALVHFMHAVTSDRERVHTFVFGTRLTNITRALRYRDVDVALAKASEQADDWSGGTRIGACLHEFNRFWNRRVLGQGAIVLLIENDAEVFPGNSPILEAVNTGAVDVGLVNHYYWVVAAAEAGGPDSMRAQMQFGEPGSTSALVNVTGAGILTGSEDSEEALEFVQFLVSEQAQTFFVEQTGEYSLVPGAPSPRVRRSCARVSAPTASSSSCPAR